MHKPLPYLYYTLPPRERTDTFTCAYPFEFIGLNRTLGVFRQSRGKLTFTYNNSRAPINLAFEAPEDLAARYTRSHPMLKQCLDASPIERLTMVAGAEGYPLVRNLEEYRPSMLATLRSLPMVAVNPNINASTLMQDVVVSRPEVVTSSN